MAEDRPISNAAIRILLDSIEEVMGANGTKAVLNAAKLTQYIDNFPERSLDKDYKFSDYGAIQQGVEDFYGPRGSRAILLRIGKATFQFGLKDQPAILGLAGVALKALPEKTRMKLILERVAKAATEKVGQPSSLMEEDDAFYYVQDDSPCRWRPAHDKPCCYVSVGALTEAMAWTTGKVYKVEEVACISNGASNCVYRIPKQPVEED